MNFFLEKIRNKLGNNLLHEMQMMGVSTVVSSLLSMFSVKCFGSITSDFRKYFESRKYYDIFIIISQIQTISNFGNHSEISEFFYTWGAIQTSCLIWPAIRKKIPRFEMVPNFAMVSNFGIVPRFEMVSNLSE